MASTAGMNPQRSGGEVLPDYATEVARTIVAQLGGTRAVRAQFGAGCALVVVGEPHAGLLISRLDDRHSAHALRITLSPSDTYRIDVFRAQPSVGRVDAWTPDETLNDIYVDQLEELLIDLVTPKPARQVPDCGGPA